MNGLTLAPDAYILLAVLASAGVVLLVLAARVGRWPLWLTGWAVLVCALAVAFFFRDPERTGERGPTVYVAPADGRVVEVARVVEERYDHGEAIRVSIFLSLFDVHVQRSPVRGVVEYVEHRPGRFGAAWGAEAGARNESTAIRIRAGDERVLVRQVAGLVARRIVTYVKEGDLVEQGDRIGLIRFGSRVEAYLPPDVEMEVRPGERVRAGETVLARRPLRGESR